MQEIVKVEKFENIIDNTCIESNNGVILYCDGGHSEVKINGERITLDANKFLVVNRGISCVFTDTSGCLLIAYLNNSFNRAPCKTFCDTPNKSVLFVLTEWLSYAEESSLNAEILLVLSQMLISYINIGVRKSSGNNVTENIKNAIKERFKDPSFKIDLLLKEYDYNPNYLRRLFKNETGVSPNEYLLNMRLNAARVLLSDSDRFMRTVKEVAIACGFSDQLYFSRIFKKTYGMSPLHYVHRFDNLQKPRKPYFGEVIEDDL